MLSFDLNEINHRAKTDPAGFVAECEHDYNRKLAGASAHLAEMAADRPIVLLAGPSGSGKTTTAHVLSDMLNQRGVGTHMVSLDNYYKTIVAGQQPLDENGEVDYESPECLDLPLLEEHFVALAEGREVGVPRFDFPRQCRAEGGGVPLKRNPGEVVIFEGIHALNPMLSGAASEASMKIYISARSSVMDERKEFFKNTWQRLLRRMIRDMQFRGAGAVFTLGLWPSVRRGEKRFISPYKDSASIILDTSHPCEVSILSAAALALWNDLPPNFEPQGVLSQIPGKLKRFVPIEEGLLSPRALLREFIGGSEIEY